MLTRYRYRPRLVGALLLLSSCFSEVVLPECSDDSECVNAGYCRCEDGYCFQCSPESSELFCDGIEAAACTVFTGNLEGFQWALPPVIDARDRIWIAWGGLDAIQLTQIDSEGQTKDHGIPVELGTPFAAVVAEDGTLMVAGDALYLAPMESTQGETWAPDSAKVASWPVERRTPSSNAWLVADSRTRLHHVAFGLDGPQSEVVVESLPFNVANTKPIHTLLLRDRYVALGHPTGSVAIVDLSESTVLNSTFVSGAQALSSVGRYVAICSPDSRLVLIDVQAGRLAEMEYPLSSSCQGIVGNETQLVAAGVDQILGFTVLEDGGLREDWSVGAIQTEHHLLRALLNGSDVFLVSNQMGKAVAYAPYAPSAQGPRTYQTAGNFASATPLTQLANGDIFHVLGNGRYFRLNLGLQRPVTGWNSFRRDHRAAALAP